MVETRENEIRVFPMVRVLKCYTCNREIKKTISDEEGLERFNKVKVRHDEYEKVNCEGIIEPKKDKKKGKNGKNKDEENKDGNKETEQEIHENYRKLFQRPERNIENIVLTKDIDKAYNVAKRYLVEYAKKGINTEIRGIVLYGPSGTGKGVTMEIIENDSEFLKYNNFVFNAQIHELTGEMRNTSEKIDGIITHANKLAMKTGKRSIIFLDDMETVLGKRKGSSVQTKIARTSSILQHFGGKLDTPGVFLFVGTNLPEEIDFAFKNRFKWCGYHLFDKYERIKFLKSCYLNYSNDGILNYEDLNSHTDENWNARVFKQFSEHLEFEYGDRFANGESISLEQAQKSIVEFKSDFEYERKERDMATEETKNPVGRPPKIDEGDISVKEFIYPSEDEMIDFLIENSLDKFKSGWIIFKEKWEQKGCIGYQLEGHLKPSYKRAKERIDNNK